MNRTFPLLLVVLVSLLGVAGASAQADLPETPLIIYADRGLYAWTPEQGTPSLLVSNSYFLTPAVSPDATEIAYTTYAPLTVDALERTGGIGGGTLPTDIWLLNPRTGDTRPLALQPDDASFFTPGVEDYAFLRSQPAWSWDGMKLAWAENIYPRQHNQVVIYDFATDTSRVIDADLPEQAMVTGPMSLTWVGAFLVVSSITEDTDFTPVESFYVFDADGTLIREIVLPDDVRVFQFESVLQDGRYYLGVEPVGSDDWQLYDPLYGTQEPLVGVLETYAWLAPETSLALEPREDEAGNAVWQAHDSVGRPVERFSSASYYGTDYITLSPDGQTVAFADYNADTRVYDDVVHVLRGSTGANVPDVSDDPFVWAVAWGPMAWRTRIRSTVAGPNAPLMADYDALQPLPNTGDVTGIVCPGAPTPRLLPGDTAIVLGTTPNNVRSQPGTSAQVVGQIPAGADFAVLEGPACQDGLTWYRVQYGALEGWTAEGQGRDYWVEPRG